MPENIQDVALAIILVFPILSTLVVGLRCWSRLLGKQFGWDDGFIVGAWILAIGQTYTAWMYTKLTYSGYHSSDVPQLSIQEKIMGQKYNLANQLLYNPILAIVKASVIVFLFRLEDRRRIVRLDLHTLSAVNLGLLSIFLSDLFQCSPFRYVYDFPAMDLAAQKATRADTKGRKETELVKGGQCINQIAFFLGSAGFTIVTDIWLLCIPAIIAGGCKCLSEKRRLLSAFSVWE